MAQKRTFEFEADDLTFDFNQRVLDCIIPGVYHGFDAVLAAGLTLNLSQEISGVSSVDKNLLTTPKNGMYITKQGVIIREDGIISLPIEVGDLVNPRIDLIVAEHFYTEVSGGQPASYLIIKGNPNAVPVPPSLTNPNKQIIIGELLVPANMSGLNDPGVVYTRSRQPDFADNNVTERLDVNESDIAQNSNDITVNADDIEQNATDISLNANNITQNESDIAQNYNDITVNADDIEQNATDISLNANNITQNTSDIATINQIKSKKIDIGDWDMDTVISKTIAHGIADWTKILFVKAQIFPDTDGILYPVSQNLEVAVSSQDYGNPVIAGAVSVEDVNIVLSRKTGGFYDSTSWNETPYNRGYITIFYLP